MNIKQYPCCTVLDFVGGVWTGLIISGCFTFIQCILAIILIGLFDKLHLPRCCMWYSGKAGEAALLKSYGGGGENITSGEAELEAGRDAAAAAAAAAPAPVVMTKTAPPRPRQSRIFRCFGGAHCSTADEAVTRPNGRISIIADATTAATQQPSAAESTDAGRRRSSVPPLPSAPQWSD